VPSRREYPLSLFGIVLTWTASIVDNETWVDLSRSINEHEGRSERRSITSA